jgi:prophage antirepressor-like protein
MSITINSETHKIRLAGTIQTPFFCGKDVCRVLGYKDTKDALKKFVDKDDKCDLNEIHLKQDDPGEILEPFDGEILGGAQRPPQNDCYLGSRHNTFRENQMLYVSEVGIYSLILSSQAPFAKEFKKLLCKVILPSIRKHGFYQVEQRLTAQLKIKEEELGLEKAAKEKAERKALRISKFMKQITVKEHKLEWIYIATTSMYASERVFKIGSTTRLSTRIGGYNTGRPIEDGYYYCWVVKCYNAKDVDYCIQKLLTDFKHRETTELYCGIRFTDLRDIVAFIVKNYDASVDYINNFIKFKLSHSLDQEDLKEEEPPILDCKRITYHIGAHTETINLENEDLGTLELIKLEISSMLTDMQQRQVDLVVDRKMLLERLEKKISSEPRKNLWTRVKEFTGWTTSKAELTSGDLNYKIVY